MAATSQSAAFAEQEEGPRVLDDQWQRQQQKTFTAWINSHLRKRSLKIEDIAVDLCDGKLLLQLVEIIADETLPKAAKGKMRIHNVENVGKALNFIQSKGVNVSSIAPEEVVDSNLKMILGLVWMLILRFEIQDISEEHMNAKDALLLWCQRKTEPYNNIDIQNFHMSWKDGLGFCGLIHRHRPDLLDFSKLRKDNPRENFELAFEVAERDLDIPKMLDVEDMLTCIKPDERSVMTYVAAYYKAFASSNKSELAAKKIAAVLETNREHERMMEEYEEMATDLLAWLNTNIERLDQRPALNTVPECQSQLEEANKFRGEEVPPKLEEKSRLEMHYATLQTKLRLSGRPPYVPNEGKEIEDIHNRWQDLETADGNHKDFLLEELRRVRLAESKAERFNAKATTHENWTQGRDEELASDDYSDKNLAGISALLKKHEAFQSDLTAHEQRVHEIGTLANELDELRYHDADSVNDRYAAIYETWQTLVQLTHDRQTNLQQAEERQRHLDDLFLEYAKQAPPFGNFAELACEKLQEPYIVDTEEDVTVLQQEHEAFKAELPQYQQAFESLQVLQQGMQELGNTSNPYSPHNFEDLSQQWTRVQELVTRRDEQLAEEASHQQGREQIRREFASAADEASAFLQNKDSTVNQIIEQSTQATLEDAVQQLQGLQTEVEQHRSSQDALEGIHQKQQEKLIYKNPHTSATIESVRGHFNALKNRIVAQVNEFNNQILSRDATNITDEQMAEFRQSFEHFDKDKSGRLERREFHGVLLSLGHPVAEVYKDDGSDKEFESIWERVDLNKEGTVTFDEFVRFKAEESAGAETSSQLLEAFQILANGQPYVMATDLQRELSPELYEYCVQHMVPYGDGPEGALDYQSFATALYGESEL
ncbi:uncharacterized protein MONBRDRAFT_32785 [Monosiga brevicollis MX1]|uniref:Alpha-actinin n=1 Tax=Monosiga brevicollis TaxID=81824 RepID=A9V1P2_MONBE|nr:uncharacterized protein MONBRDRAFT_32785 [Monosiga brevicollis MX1]EDQ88477.1 predicted protein [Monosiga brevicollis MX1]|eukprot:XP_001746581.1 hypothetical protein [Monosiga brevicollis MX1]